MRKVILFTFCILIFKWVNAQTFTNSDFEAPFISPVQGLSDCSGWTGYYSIDTTTAYSGSQSIKISTTVSPEINAFVNWGNDTVPGSAYTNPPMQGNWGWNSTNWTSIAVSFYYKHQIAVGDTALILLILSYDNNTTEVCAIGVLELTGSVNTWQNHTLNITDIAMTNCGFSGGYLSLVAKSTTKTFLSCNGCNNYNVGNGIAESALWLDDISVSYTDISASNEIHPYIKSQIFPNPVTNEINIKVPEEIESVDVFDIQGKLVLRSNKSLIDASSLSQGIYSYTIRTIKGQLSNGKIVKINN